MNQGTITVDIKLQDADFKRALASADKAAEQTARSIGQSQDAAASRVSDRFSSLGTIATRAFQGAAVTAGLAGVASVKMAGDFEQSLNVFQSVSGATAKQMQAVAKAARDLGNDASLPGISARDAAAALTELAKAGLTVNQSLAASKGVLSLAKAGNLEVADAAAIAARALNAFALDGSKAAQVADLLAAGANASSADVSDMALGLQQAASGAHQMGVSLPDTITALSLFANAGIAGSDAGTSLKQMFLQLVNPSKLAAATMTELGLKFFDAKGNFVGLSNASQQLQTRLGKLTTEQRNAALATIFGSDSARVAGILAQNGAKGFDAMAVAVNKQGAATELAAAQNKGLNGAVDNLISTLQTIGIDLATKVVPPLTQFFRIVAAQLPAALEFATTHFQDIIRVVLGLGVAFAAVRIAAFVSDLRLATLSLQLFVGANNAAGIKAIGAAFAFMGRSALAGFAAVRAGTIGVRAALIGTGIGAAVVAVGLAAELIITHWDKVTAHFSGKDKQLQPFFKGVADAFKGLQDTVGQLGAELDRAVVPALERFAKSLDGPTGKALELVLKTTVALAKLLGDIVIREIADTLNALAGFIRGVDDAIKGAERFADLTVKAFRVVSDVVGKGVGAVAQFARAAEAGFQAASDSVVRSFEAMRRALEPWQKDFQGTFVKTLENVSKALIDYDLRTLKSWDVWLQGTLDATAKWGGRVLDAAGKSLSRLTDQVSAALTGLPDAIGKWLDESYRRVVAWGEGILKAALSATTSLATQVGNDLAGLPDAIGRWLDEAQKRVVDWGTTLITNGSKAVDDFITSLNSFFATIPDRVSNNLNVAGTRASGSLLDGLKNYLKQDNNIRSVGDAIVGFFALVLASIAIYLVDVGVRLMVRIIEGARQKLRDFIDTGKQIILGIAQGIEDNAGRVVDKIKQICGQALDAVKRFFGIHSPSTVMAEMGSFLMQGLADGITKGGGLASDAMAGVADSLLGNFGSAGAVAVDGSLTGSVASSAGGSGRSVTQNNNYYIQSQVDFDEARRQDAWGLARG